MRFTARRTDRPTWKRSLLMTAVAALTLLGSMGLALADHTCSAPGQPPCSCGILCYRCDYQYLILLGQCSDADGWPASCGGENERPCSLAEHIPSCKSGLAEVPFPGGNCTRLDGQGFPSFCGDVGERACYINEHIPSCKSGLIEERGFCRAFDEDGYPTSCGGTDEPACDLIVQAQIGKPSCKACNVEIPLGGTCRAIGADRFPSVCGGCDQPSCDLSVRVQTLQPACMPGLTEQAGMCRRLDANGSRMSCVGLGEPSLATTAQPAPTPAGQPVWGFADLHAHPFANLAFGGMVLWGSPFHEEGIASALPYCDQACGIKAVNPLGAPITPLRFPNAPGVPVHPFLGMNDLIGKAMSDDADFWHDHSGYPEFTGWPRSVDQTHQQMYYKWIERAYRGGMKLMVANAVNNEVLCRVADRQRDFACEDMPTVDRQIAAIKDMERFIDLRSGGPGAGWFRIAYSAAEAREIVRTGKMAVVLGIEVDSLFGCKKGSTCTADDVRQGIDAYHAMGVRHMFPIHLFDNDFGGTAVYFDFFNVGSALSNGGDFLSVTDCASQGFEFRLSDTSTEPAAVFLLNTFRDVLGIDLDVPGYPQTGAHCNARGLTALGESLVKMMMGRKMIIDVDHMSHRALDRTLGIAVEQSYPVVSGHSRFLEAMADSPGEDEMRAEYDLEERHVQTIRSLGGLMGPILHQGHASDMRGTGQVPNDCSNSTKTWAQAYLYAVDRMRGGPYHDAVGLGSDFNGGISPAGPRFGDNACAGDEHPAPQGAGVTYPFAAHGVPGTFGQMSTGSQTFDYNTTGLAHVGLLPDFIEDLKKVGLTNEDLRPLFSSAEAYIAMWERIEAKSLFPPTTDAVLAPAPNANGWNRADVGVTLAAAGQPDGWGVEEIHLRADGAQTMPPGVVSGAQAQALFTREGETTLRFHAEDAYGNVEPEQSIAVRIDRTPPTVAVSGNAGSYLVDATLNILCSASDALSGVEPGSCPGVREEAWRFSLGTNNVTVRALDRAGNTGSAPVSFTVAVTLESLKSLTRNFVSKPKVEKSLVALLTAIGRAGTDTVKKARAVSRFKSKVSAQVGKSLTRAQADALITFVDSL